MDEDLERFPLSGEHSTDRDFGRNRAQGSPTRRLRISGSIDRRLFWHGPRVSRNRAVVAKKFPPILAALDHEARPPFAAAPLGAWALPLAILAAVAEEALFRRAAYGWLARSGALIAVVGSALLFAAIHLPLYGAVAFPVDLGAGLLLSWQRWASGTWTVPAATHAAANLLAVMLR